MQRLKPFFMKNSKMQSTFGECIEMPANILDTAGQRVECTSTCVKHIPKMMDLNWFLAAAMLHKFQWTISISGHDVQDERSIKYIHSRNWRFVKFSIVSVQFAVWKYSDWADSRLLLLVTDRLKIQLSNSQNFIHTRLILDKRDRYWLIFQPFSSFFV